MCQPGVLAVEARPGAHRERNRRQLTRMQAVNDAQTAPAEAHQLTRLHAGIWPARLITRRHESRIPVHLPNDAFWIADSRLQIADLRSNSTKSAIQNMQSEIAQRP